MSFRSMLISLIGLAYALPALVMLAFVVWFVSLILKAQPSFLLLTVLLALPFGLGFGFLFVFQVLFSLGLTFLTYLEVSPSGIAYYKWPSYGVRCNWEDVERLEQRRSLGFIRYDVLVVRNPEYFGWGWVLGLRDRLRLKRPNFVPVSEMMGRPNTKLADALAEKLPGIFPHSA